jgi:hypothetical protein
MWSIVEPTRQILYPPNCLVRQASLWSWGCFQGPIRIAHIRSHPEALHRSYAVCSPAHFTVAPACNWIKRITIQYDAYTCVILVRVESSGSSSWHVAAHLGSPTPLDTTLPSSPSVMYTFARFSTPASAICTSTHSCHRSTSTGSNRIPCPPRPSLHRQHQPYSEGKKLRIGLKRVFGWEMTRPFRDARRFPSPGL